MKEKKSIDTLKEYESKYSKHKNSLLKFSEKEINDFDKLHKTKNELLKDRKWKKFGDSYYEIPDSKNIFRWFKNLSLKAKIIICAIAGGSIATAITVPIVLLNKDHFTNFTTTVRKVTSPEFGNIDFEATMNDFKNHGFDYGDMVDLTIHDVFGEKDYNFILPIVTNYNEAGPFAVCLCNYEGLSDRLDLSFAMHPLKDVPELLLGKKVDVKMKKKRGFQKTRELIKCPGKLTYEQVNRNNSFYANFRNVCQTGYMPFKNDILYRGSSPFNYKANGNERYSVADKLMGHYGVNCEISLSCDENTVKGFMDNLNDSYSTKILYNKTLKSVGINDQYAFNTYNLAGDYFTFDENATESTEKLPGGNLIHNIFDMMFNVIKNYQDSKGSIEKPIFYFHCNEGKDRTGFFGMLIEALCGCSVEDIVSDYMLTFQHYYNITLANSPEKYNALAEQTIYRYIYSICIDNPVDELWKINWNSGFDVKAEVNKIINGSEEKLQECAQNYIFNLCKPSERAEWKLQIPVIQNYLMKNVSPEI